MTMVTWAGMMLSRAGLVICQPTTSTTFAVLSSVVKLSQDSYILQDVLLMLLIPLTIW